LREKRRAGARVIKRYHPPVVPAARVLAHPAVAEEDKVRLRGNRHLSAALRRAALVG
jgi:hypothetical protein